MSRVLVVAPHPDDEVFGVGGTIAHHVARGDEVHVAVVTVAHPPLFEDSIVPVVREEARQAWAILGVASSRFLDVPAALPEMTPNHVLNHKIAAVVQDLRPQTLYLPFPGDLHVDHQRVFLAGLVAARPAPGCAVRRVLCYETLSETNWNAPFLSQMFQPNVFVEISNFLEAKIRAASCYKTQVKPFPNERSLEALRALAIHRGATVGVPAAEAFVLVREVVVSDRCEEERP